MKFLHNTSDELRSVSGAPALVHVCEGRGFRWSTEGRRWVKVEQLEDATFKIMLVVENYLPSLKCYFSLDDMPELQEVEEDQRSTRLFQVGAVSHQELSCSPSPNWLAELANIATSPQSPLLKDAPHKRSSPVHIFGTSNSLHSYARPPLASSAPNPYRGHLRERSESESGVFSMSSSFSDDEDMAWSHSWPSTAWHCFLKVLICFINCSSYQAVLFLIQHYGSDGLKLVNHEETLSFSQAILKLTFDPGSPDQGLLTAEWWSSFYPSLTVVHHGIPCYEMQLGDVCLPPTHPEAINCDDSVVFDTFRSYDFTPLDSSAVYVLSNMARQRRASLSSGGAVSPVSQYCEKLERSCSPQSSSSKSNRSNNPGTASGATPTKCKRPMNAFMLFAKKYRVEYTQMYPGKDNRAISSEERRMYTMEAKALAEEQKRLNPDCWKRKRTNSVSTNVYEPLAPAGLFFGSHNALFVLPQGSQQT
uniref:HMG-box transcription factor 1 n=1 Tax=Gouania willdenowi TaxID=441366 RepID=A0A8C5EDB5_GOUWI